MTLKLSLNKASAREAAYLALIESLKNNAFIADTLELWKKEANPNSNDYHLAQQIAFGACQRALTLDYYAKELSKNKKVSLKLKEKALLRTALYQYYFLERIPIYAIANETVNLAKKYCHPIFIKFLNALLRRLPEGEKPKLPENNSIENLSINYSFPPFYVSELVNDYGFELAKTILDLGNQPSDVHVKIRNDKPLDENFSWVDQNLKIAKIDSLNLLDTIAKDNNYYIQNATPITLINHLAQHSKSHPKRILDLCSAPGGKLLALHDLFSKAELNANDVSETKVAIIKQNCEKYDIKAQLSCSPGESLKTDAKYDIIVIDAPCSNTGVLNKRAEARWRLTQESLNDLTELQLKLIQNAVTLLTETGQIWFMTCSILKSENESVARQACERFNLKLVHQETILPNSHAYDGGYAALLTTNVI